MGKVQTKGTQIHKDDMEDNKMHTHIHKQMQSHEDSHGHTHVHKHVHSAEEKKAIVNRLSRAAGHLEADRKSVV